MREQAGLGAEMPMTKRAISHPKADILAWQIMPNCAETSREVYLEWLDLAAPEEDYKPAEFLRTAKGGVRYPAVAKMNLHEASAPMWFITIDS